MSNTLVAYFSASGTTGRVAKHLAEAADADLYEIKPAKAYSKTDLDWTNRSSRSSVEMNDPMSRPELADHDAQLDGYDTIFIGFPIWWYTAPHIINSFLESYDFAGKKIVLFATSGGSGLGHTAQALEPSCPGATIVDGKLLNGNPSVRNLRKWVESL